ncbi:bifunctional lysylphosphatidylglycerol synthetase/lysine--tRNA ligase LysX [Tsukamurella sputi]|uniref:bifunctional lysylphosphatidylglycerol synthetase/lysine--tRNA ligase LysX n=1 Tax=Tsukamurella sputi TaxID=2591848 RepID=UPI001E45983C|nr:bifunctional lysylphosphatidylglycerol synthetase/lysine--tRNA ligase LysX [Tsukamurella sputi]
MLAPALRSYSAAPRTTEDRRDRFARWIAKQLARLTAAAALVSLLTLLFRGQHLFLVLADLISALGIPTEPSLFVVALLALLSGALRRRLRAAHTVTLVLMAVTTLANAVDLVAIVTRDPRFEHAPHLFDAYWSVRESALGAAAVVILAGASFVAVAFSRRAFSARLTAGSKRAAAATLVGGFGLAYGITLALTAAFPHTLSGIVEEATWALRSTFGVIVSPGRDFLLDGRSGFRWVYAVSGALSAVVLVVTVMAFWRAPRGSELLTEDDELAVRMLLVEHGENDSLGYFATRRDKSVVLAPDGRAAITFRDVGTVSLASADPIGDRDSWAAAIDRWLAHCREHGHYPAVSAASVDAARMFADAGLRTLTLGDEAIVDVDSFTLKGRPMRAVRQAVTRLRTAGYVIDVRRHSELTAADRAELADRAERWRGQNTERGFTMALNRLGDDLDGRCVLVTARDADGAAQGFLSFVPWGARGLSLDLMRRSPSAENGLIEAMVAHVIDRAPTIGVRRISLNFAIFRAVFFGADDVGAGPVTRLSDAVLGFASRFLQMETLYRSNEKYRPEWVPRLLCYDPALTVVRTVVAVAIAEGYIPHLVPRFLAGRRRSIDQPARDPDFVRRALAAETGLLAREAPAPRLSEQERVRRRTLDAMEAAGMPGYPRSVPRTHGLAQVRAEHPRLPPGGASGTVVSVTGRVRAIRDFGGVTFTVLEEDGVRLQVIADRAGTQDATRSIWRAFLDLGDLVAVTGEVIASRTGELSVRLESWAMAAKCLSPVPALRARIADDARARHRVLDLITNRDAVDLLYRRSAGVAALRAEFAARGFTEVETPMLQGVHGGAAARPFVTHINAYDQELYLRIAPELYLKRLAVSGMGRIFEINRNFRNEGVDATHNPEFTALEAYEAYGDYDMMRELTREVILAVAVAMNGRPVARRPEGEVDLSGEWPVVTVHEAVSRATGTTVTSTSSRADVAAVCARFGVAAAPAASAGELVVELYEALVEKRTTSPTFYCDFPVEVAPLARRKADDPALTERWDLVGFGAELGTAYTELNDPVDQRARLTRQSMAAAAGDPEAMQLDEGFLKDLTYAMPPTGGLGLGVDRIVMLLAGVNIRATLAFPFVRPRATE